MKTNHAIAFALTTAAIVTSGKGQTGLAYALWQSSRRGNHSYWFYPVTVPQAMGLLVVAL